MAPAFIACAISPRSLHCGMLSATTTSAFARTPGSSSILSGVSEPIAVMCVPGRTWSAVSSGDRDGVDMMMRLLVAATAPASSVISTVYPWASISFL